METSVEFVSFESEREIPFDKTYKMADGREFKPKTLADNYFFGEILELVKYYLEGYIIPTTKKLFETYQQIAALDASTRTVTLTDGTSFEVKSTEEIYEECCKYLPRRT